MKGQETVHNEEIIDKNFSEPSPYIKGKLEKISSDRDSIPTEGEIRKKYIELPDNQVDLFCSYTTRLDGFLDILLSRCILSSREAEELLGIVHTHRGNSMTSEGETSGFSDHNDYISLSTGFVSFKYSDAAIRKRENYLGGYGLFIPLDTALQNQEVGFSHCSRKGGIKNYDLNRDNIYDATHKARKEGELFDDGYGNVFEVELEALHEKKKKSSSGFSFKKVLEYPRVSIYKGILAIPTSARGDLEKLLTERQNMYKDLLDKINAIPDEVIEQYQRIDDRDFLFPKKTQQFLKEMLRSIDLDELPIYWYPQENLDTALQHVSVK